MGLWKITSTLLTAIFAIWWAISETKYNALIKNAVPSSNHSDPAYTLSTEELGKAVYCPREDASSSSKETVLLVHGTGMTPETNWDYTLLQPLLTAGYNPCYIAIPKRLLNDIQISAEYLSHAIKTLSNASSNSNPNANSLKPISIISWSAGALTTQWTLTFYPETRTHVRQHIALAGDFHGTWTMKPLVWLKLYTPAIVQQVRGSRFLSALAAGGGYSTTTTSIVPTTCIGSSTDLIVQPGFYGDAGPQDTNADSEENNGAFKFGSGLGRVLEWAGLRDSWRLPGANNYDLFKICAALRIQAGQIPGIVSHESILWEEASHRIIFDALASGSTKGRGQGRGDSLLNDAGIRVEECGRIAEGILRVPGSEERLGDIMPELSGYASKMPVSGWPEVPLFGYAQAVLEEK